MIYNIWLQVRITLETKRRLLELAGGPKNMSQYVRDLIDEKWLALHPEGEPSRLDEPPAGTA